jgi:hypothetical protein
MHFLGRYRDGSTPEACLRLWKIVTETGCYVINNMLEIFLELESCCFGQRLRGIGDNDSRW